MRIGLIAGVALITGCLGAVGSLPTVDGGTVGAVVDAGGGTTGTVDAGLLPGSCANPGGAPAEIQFINRFTDRTLLVTWTDPDCKPSLALTLTPQSYGAQSSNIGDLWRVKDSVSGETLFEGPTPDGVTTLVFPRSDTQVCSKISNTAVTTTFRNKFVDKALSLLWVDPACKETLAGDLPARSDVSVKTFAGHVFRFRQAGSGTLVESVPPLEATTTNVGVPSDGTAPVCSDNGMESATVMFQNNYPSKTVTVFWVDYKCLEVTVGSVAPGASLPVSTHYTHAFRVRDAANDALLASPPAISAASVTISVP